MTAETNTRKATGPTSPEGKTRSSMNALKHGLYAKHTVVLNNESREVYDHLRDEYWEQFQPATPLERDLIEELISCRWRLRRIAEIETAALDHQMDAAEDEIRKRYETIDEPGRLFIATVESEASLQSIRRIETSLSRQHERVLRQLCKAQELRRTQGPALPDAKPEAQPQPIARPPAPSNPQLRICRNELPESPETSHSERPQPPANVTLPPEKAA